MVGRLEGKVVIVTGGATGIGEAASWLFASEGAAVIVADTKAKEEKAKTMVEEIQFQGGTANFVRADIAKPGEIEAMVLKAVAGYGKLDCAFNAATVSGAAPIIETTIDQW